MSDQTRRESEVFELYEELLKITGKLGDISSAQARTEQHLESTVAHLQEVTSQVTKNREALENGVRKDVRDLRDELRIYKAAEREDTCFFLRWQREQQARGNQEQDRRRVDRERRKFDFRQTIATGIILLLLSTVVTIVVTRGMNKQLHAVEEAVEHAQENNRATTD